MVDQAAAASSSLPVAVAEGYSILVLHEFASPVECSELLDAALTRAKAISQGSVSSEEPGKLSLSLAFRLEHSSAPMVSSGRVRMPIAGLSSAACALCDTWLLRVLELIDKEEPALAAELFDGPPLAPELRAALSEQPVHSSPSLTFTHNEPAVNLYSAGGAFEPHKDLQALTVLMPLVGAGSFEGGGTGFWARKACVADDDASSSSRSLGSMREDIEEAEPSVVLTPPAGSALLFGGDLQHAGQPVTAGQRAVFVASFSRSLADAQARGLVDIDEEELRRMERTVLSQMYGGDGASGATTSAPALQ